MNASPGRPDLTTYRAVVTADVWKGSRKAATLTRTDDGVRFAYTDDYLHSPGPAVATTLPLAERPVLTPAGAVPPFFAGLLPEGRRLTALRTAVKTSADDDLTLLLAVGTDPVGDVRVLPAGQEPTSTAPLVEVHRAWDEISFTEVLADAGVRDPVALAGVQDKASARMLSVPLSRSGRRFLLKVDPPEYPHLVVNESYFLALARAKRFPAVRATVVHDRDARPGLLVERFDRVRDQATGVDVALPVEDAGQLLGIYPADKYRVTTEQVTDAVGAVCAATTVALQEVFRQLVFAWLTGNGDLHAKNVSVLGTGSGEWRVAPAYDIPSTLPYRDFTLALTVGGRTDGLSRRSLLELADRIGLPAAAAERTLDRVLQATEEVLTDWGPGGCSPFAAKESADVLRALKQRRLAAS